MESRISILGRRLMDILVASWVLVFGFLLWLVVALAIKLDSPGPALYSDIRVGRDGREFRILKFRSMVPNGEGTGSSITTSGDRRVTRVGRFLRRWKLDEIPQLWNVLRGEMALVGPRPEDPCYVEGYDHQQADILSFRPGLTSPASIAYRNEEELLAAGTDPEALYRDEILPDKIKMDLKYFRERDFFSDCSIIARTAVAVLRSRKCGPE